MPVSHHSVFTVRMPFLPPNQQRQSTKGKLIITNLLVTNFQTIITKILSTVTNKTKTMLITLLSSFLFKWHFAPDLLQDFHTWSFKIIRICLTGQRPFLTIPHNITKNSTASAKSSYYFTFGTKKSMTFHCLVLTVPCNVCKYSFMYSIGSAVTDPESTKTSIYFQLQCKMWQNHITEG